MPTGTPFVLASSDGETSLLLISPAHRLPQRLNVACYNSDVAKACLSMATLRRMNQLSSHFRARRENGEQSRQYQRRCTGDKGALVRFPTYDGVDA